MDEFRLEQQILELSLKELYLTENAAINELPKHQIWQAPLMFPKDINDLIEFDLRIKKAGLLWLKNRDLIPHNTIILTHKTAWISYVFQRIQAPNQHPKNLLAIPRKLIKEGTHLPPYPLIFQEFTES
jgi:hypothetical protein